MGEPSDDGRDYNFRTGIGGLPTWAVMILIVFVATSIAPLVIAIVVIERILSWICGGDSEDTTSQNRG